MRGKEEWGALQLMFNMQDLGVGKEERRRHAVKARISGGNNF